jgi:hypothetical protein
MMMLCSNNVLASLYGPLLTLNTILHNRTLETKTSLTPAPP